MEIILRRSWLWNGISIRRLNGYNGVKGWKNPSLVFLHTQVQKALPFVLLARCNPWHRQVTRLLYIQHIRVRFYFVDDIGQLYLDKGGGLWYFVSLT